MASGKGINVARSLTILGKKARATGFLGGATGKDIDEYLRREGIEADFVHIRHKTRTCITLLARDGTQTEITEPGAAVSAEEEKRFLRKFERLIVNTEIITISGTIPPGVSSHIYYTLISRAKKRGIRSILDTGGEAFTQGKKAKPFLLKSNWEELEAARGKSIKSRKEIKSIMREYLNGGIEWMVTTRGKQGALFGKGNKVWQVSPPRIKSVNTIGSGDTMCAGISSVLLDKGSAEEMMRWGVACATANTLISGPGIIRREDIKKIYPRIKITLL